MAINCPKCHFDNPDNSRLCASCGIQSILSKIFPSLEPNPLRNSTRLILLFLIVLSLGIKISSQQRTGLLEMGKPTVKISIYPLEPTTKDMITFTVNAQDNSGTGLKRIAILINEKEVKACLTSPCVFVGGPYPEGSLEYGAKVLDYTDNEPWTGNRKVYVRKAPRSAGLPGKIIKLLPLAENVNTQWANGYVDLPFPGEESDFRGFAGYRYDALLEDDKKYSQVLLMRPQLRDEFGLILGIFRIENLPAKATFRTRIGFLKEASQTDGAEFRVFVKKDPSFYEAKRCYYDGRLDDLALYLGRYAGQKVDVVLQVHVLYTSTQDLAVWIDPRIEW